MHMHDEECGANCSVPGCQESCFYVSIHSDTQPHECSKHRGRGTLTPVPCFTITVSVGEWTAAASGRTRWPMSLMTAEDNEEAAVRLAENMVRDAYRRYREKAG